MVNTPDVCCKYAICTQCNEKYASKGRRKKLASRDETRANCNHEIHNLLTYTEPWWCSRKNVKRGHSDKPEGCVACEKKFIGEY